MSSAVAADNTDEVRIGDYEDWMFDQVVDMVVGQYGRGRDFEADHFQAFYGAPFQLPHGIRLVAVDGETVCGFLSYCYWPYVYQGRRLRSFQAGSSLVSPDYRGRGIFARLLNHLVETDDRPQIDFLMGFPVEMSYGSFIRNGWHNPLDLSWYVRPIRPLSVFSARQPGASDWCFETTPEHVDAFYPEQRVALSKDEDFLAWRANYAVDGAGYLYLHHREGGKTIRFALKLNRRGRINELVVGDIVRESEDPALLESGLRALIKATRGHSFVTLLSIALNAECTDQGLVRALRGRSFFKIKKKIHFIVKPMGGLEGLIDPGHWQLFRSDIDTW